MSKTNKRPENKVVSQAYLKESGSVVSFLSPDASIAPVKQKVSDTLKDDEFQPWGEDNNWPKESRLKLEESTTAAPLIANMVGMMFGRGLVYYKEVRTGTELSFEFPVVPEINQFLINNDVNYLMLERLMDYKTFGNIFTEFIKNKSNSKIINVFHLEAEFTRFGKVDKNGKILDLKFTGDWEKKENLEPIPYISRRDRSKENLLKFRKKVGIHSCMPSPGRTLYAQPPHGALFKKNGWLDYANSVPQIMNSVNTNAMNIKYHIQIPDTYWISTNPEWNTLSNDERNIIIDDKLDEMDNWLTGTNNTHKSFISHFATDPLKGTKLTGWDIKVLDDKSSKGAYLTSLQEADTQITRAIRSDISMAGIQSQGGKLGAGSGSDKRVGFHNTLAMSHADILIITEPMRVIQQYNGWDPDIKWGFWHDVPTTLNENKSGSEPNID